MRHWARRAAAAVWLPLLAGCAGPPAPTVQALSAPTSFEPGVVAAVRPVQIPPGQGGGGAGLQAVLAALQTGAPATTATGQEIVITRPGGDVSCTVQPTTASFMVGDKVSIAESNGAALLHRD